MNRSFALAIGMIVVLGIGFIAGTSASTGGAKSLDTKQTELVKPPIVIGQKTAVFNMPAVMRDFHQAKYEVWLLTNKKNELSKDLMAFRADYVQLKTVLDTNPNHPNKDELNQKLVEVTRKIEDEDRRISKKLNDSASDIISQLYKNMKIVVDQIAEEKGFQLVFAYPDAVTNEERESSYVRELKLKPPAAQPFYVAHGLDITEDIVKTLNEKYPPIDPKTKQPVDVSQLQPIPQLPVTPPLPLPGNKSPIGNKLPIPPFGNNCLPPPPPPPFKITPPPVPQPSQERKR